MEILYMLIPISVILVGLIALLLLWAVKHGQFEDMEGPAHRILLDDDSPVIPTTEEERDAKK
ncbi:cbb3-type cytochrome oxidase assembly protein CcoS [Parasulfuritortus cantonensis]|uniref:Cbb3-type cytochrome oxidase assembly protein CcoS n=1 Tax=Parasulfuritortus cantonensis TaxID=2528202 RepID=A0A4R1BGE7_9PROT|nr:cbb3-type cytochrome oxidase assembly protein CcoS [Parasulfuritortus cantonensis]TCJ16296.1 cbb3-type cytochrome oxidase assembly protein CcoS [Parasulfuritortus cantonensis]